MRSVAFGLAIGCVVAGCMAPSRKAMRAPEWEIRQQKMNEITTLWVQIRDWRREGKMDLDPPPSIFIQMKSLGVREAARACPDVHKVPPSCGDVCNLGEAICDNAERICHVADELGRDDQMAQEKCTSAKASCREAKQRCCNCSASAAPSMQSPDVAPTGVPAP